MSNDFLPFGTAGGAPVLSQAAWISAVPANGRAAGILPKEYFNKAIRQGANMASAIGTIVTNRGGNALDDGNIAGLAAAIEAALAVFLVAGSQFTGGNQLLSPNGYQKLPGGLIVQWGSSSIGDIASGNGSTGSVAFPLAFPTAAFNVVASIQDASTTVAGAVYVAGPPTLSGFNWRAQEWVGLAQNSTLVWHAFGK